MKISDFQTQNRDYPRPAPSALWESGWHGCIKVSENGWSYSVEVFYTEAEADAWSIKEVIRMKGMTDADGK